MIKYAKLVNGAPVLAPDKIKLNGRVYTGKIPQAVYAAAGYYPIVGTVKPENMVEDGWQIVFGTIQKKYREWTPDEQEELNKMVVLSGDEADEYLDAKDVIEALQEVFE